MKTDLNIFSGFAKSGKEIERITGNNCIIYTRVSSKEQEEGYSLDTQQKAIENFREQRKLNCLASFGGFFESASKGERAEFNRMITFARKSKEKVSFILVAHSDRFDRKGANGIYITETLRKENIRLLSVSNPVDTFTPEGKFSQNIQFVVSEFDNDQRRLKCGNGMRDMLLDGYWPSRVPAGYSQKMEKGVQTITVNETGKILRKAFEWKAENKYNNLEIIKKLNALGVKMTKSRLSVTFKNPFYCGVLVHNMLDGKVIEGKHEKLISKELFIQINNLGSKNPKGKHAKEFENVPLKHFIKCGECGTPFSGYLVRKKNLWYYKCNKVGCKCNKRDFHLNNKFVNFLSNFHVLEQYISPVKDEFMNIANTFKNENKGNETLYKSKLTELDKNIEKIEEKFILGDIDKGLFEKYKAKFQSEKKQILQVIEGTDINLSNLEKTINKYCNLLMNIPSMWASGGYNEKIELQNLLFPDGILYYRNLDDYRTTKINAPILDLLELAGSLKGGKNKTASLLADGSSLVAGDGFEPTTFGL